MLPDTENYEPDETGEGLEEEKIADKTYLLDFTKLTIGRMIDGSEAKRQAIRKILLTESEISPVYDAGYGRMFDDLPGHPMSYALAEAKNRIRDAVLQDDRFSAVFFDDYQIKGNMLLIGLTAICVDGERIEMEGIGVDV